MRKVHSGGQRERQNMKSSSVNHQLEPKRVRDDGREVWCCPHCRDKAKKQEE